MSAGPSPLLSGGHPPALLTQSCVPRYENPIGPGAA